MNRRSFLKTGALGALAAASQAAVSQGGLIQSQATPAEIEGPFYPVLAQQDKDFDLTSILGQQGKSLGQHIVIEGVVVDTEGQPVEGATMDLWQANAAGRYAHPHDTNPAPLDENFQGWAIVPSGKDGGFRFKTVLPGSYPVSKDWVRPPHIHFKVIKRGYLELITQMYFPDQALNKVDRLLQRKSKKDQQRMIADRLENNPDTYYYRIVIEKI